MDYVNTAYKVLIGIYIVLIDIYDVLNVCWDVCYAFEYKLWACVMTMG